MNKKLQKQTEMIVELMSFHKIHCQTLSDCLMVIYKLNPSLIRHAIDTEITFLIELRNSIDPKDEFDCSTNSDEWS